MPKARQLEAFWTKKRKLNVKIKSRSLASYRSAVMHFANFSCTPSAKKQRWGPSQFRKLGTALTALKKKGADLVRAGLASGEVGKKPLPLTDYRRVCKATLLLGPSSEVEGAAAPGVAHARHCTALHVFSVLGWCLVMRCDNVVSIHTKHLDFSDDMLEVGVNKSKRHEAEEFEYFRVSANPFFPFACPILALGVHFACEPSILTGGGPIFPMRDAESTLNRQLTALFNCLKLEGFGSHSFRKVTTTDLPRRTMLASLAF